MNKLDYKTIAALSQVSREFYMLSQDPQLWKNLFMKEFGPGASVQKYFW